MALNEALEAGADEALMLDINGNVATCNATNFFAVVGGALWTSTGMHCLPGITRANVLRVAQEMGLDVQERDFPPSDLGGAEEAFVTGTFGGLTPVSRIDELEFAPGGPLTTRLRDGYRGLIARYVSDARHGVAR
jgi:branched-chain amino acid aminotransferase